MARHIIQPDTLQHVTFTQYDNLNRPVTVTQNYKNGVFDPAKPDEDIQRITHYDPAGNVIEQIDPPNANGESRVTRTWYDALNRVISTTTNFTTTSGADPNTYNLTTWYEYDPAGNQVAITDTQQHVARNYYDKVGRLISTTVNYWVGFGPNHLNQYNLTTWYEYDRVGNRVAITDPLTSTVRYAYDKLNRVVATTNVSGTTYTQYDAIGNRIAVTDALTHTTIYTYNAVGQLIAEGNPVAGNITRYQYDALGRTIIITDPLTHAGRTFYDAAGRVVSTTNALTGTTVITYNALGQRVGFLNENGKSGYMAYDGLGRTLSITDATNSIMQYVYDAAGNRVKVIDGLTHPMTSTYDVANRLIKTQDALGNTTRYGYDSLGNRVVMTDANGVATGYGYDAVGRLSTVTESMTSTTGLDPNKYNLITRYGYDPIGNRVAMTDALTHTTVYTYDALSRLIMMQDARGSLTRYLYDAVGNRAKVIDANNQIITYTYDALNRNTQIDYGTSGVTFEYDKVGNRKAMTDSLGVTRYDYDELNRLKQVTDPFTGTVQYRYDAVGNRTQLIYPDGKMVTYTFDAANRLTGTLSWDGQLTTYAFDKAGRLITTTLPNGVTTINDYDDANRTTRLTHSRNGTTLADYQFALDKLGNRVAITETVRQPTIQTWVRNTQTYTVAQSTDEAYIASPSGSINLAGSYTQMGKNLFETTWSAGYRFLSVTLPSAAQVISGELRLTAYANATGTPTFEVYGEAAEDPATYTTYNDFMARALTSSSVQWTVGSWQQNTAYSIGLSQPLIEELLQAWKNGNPMAFQVKGQNVGNRQAWSVDGDSAKAARLALTYDHLVTNNPSVTTTIQYVYDPLYRLTNAAYSGAYTYTFEYGYDKVGNRTVQTRTVASTRITHYVYDAANRLISDNFIEGSTEGGATYTWDNNGNLINDGSATYLYDRANRMISTTVGGITSLYAYNGDGARLKQTVAGTVTTYTQDLVAPLPVVLQAKTGSAITQYLYSIGTRPLGQYTSAWEYLLPDALGSVRQIVDANGNVTLAESYEPYGSVLSSTGTASSIFAYAGEQIDTTGLIYLRARYLNPRLGIFLARDPWSGDQLRPGSMNGWNYTEGNPVNAVDPSGKAPPWPNEDQAITALKPDILASASRHNTSLTNMDNPSFAALMTVILHWEGRLPGNLKGEPGWSNDAKGDLAGYLIGYDATTGIGNIRPSVALEILEGKIPGLEGTFCYKIEGGYDYDSLMHASFWTGVFGSWMRPEEILFANLQQSKISLEYLAANLQRGADRITQLGFKASAFNLASWHHAGVQTPEFIRERGTGNAAVTNGLSYANQMLQSMQDGFAALGFAFGNYLPNNPEEAEFVLVSVTVNPPPSLPVIIKDR